MKLYECPSCKFVVHAIEYSQARFGYFCPRCNSCQLSQFREIEWIDEDMKDTDEIAEPRNRR